MLLVLKVQLTGFIDINVLSIKLLWNILFYYEIKIFILIESIFNIIT